MSMIKETIIFSSSLSENEYLKSLANFNVATFATRVMKATRLAEYSLQRSGLTLDRTYLPENTIAAKLYESILQIDYFKKYTFSDVHLLIKSLNNLRYHIIGNEKEEIHNKLPSKTFSKKNEALIQVYDLLMNLFDEEKIYDEIELIRFAIDKAIPMEDIIFQIYEKPELKPLEKELLKKLSNNNFETLAFDENIYIDSYLKAFGQTNEVEAILQYIYENKIPFDKCLIATADTNDYAKIFRNYADILRFPLTIGQATSIGDTNPGKLFFSIFDYLDSSSHISYLKSMISSPYFNKERLYEDIGIIEDLSDVNEGLEYPDQIDENVIIEAIGNLRFDFTKDDEIKFNAYKELVTRKYKEEENAINLKNYRLLPFVERYFQIFCKGLKNFFADYLLINGKKEPTEIDAYSKILTCLSYMDDYNIPFLEIARYINGIEIGSVRPQSGHLHLTSISKAASCLREYLFVVGLSSSNYPGKAVEDPIAMDQDYEKFGIKNASEKRVGNNKDAYFALLGLASKYNCKIHLSYSYYNSETLKNQSASSVVFETYRKENGAKKTINDFDNEFKVNKEKYHTVEYFDSNLLYSNVVGKIFTKNERIALKEKEEKEFIEAKGLTIKENKKYSASAVEMYAKCPYMFFMRYVLGIEQPNEIDVNKVIEANDAGTLAHHLLENLDKNETVNKDQFISKASQIFDEYMIMHPNDNPVVIENEKHEFLIMMANAFDMEEKDKSIIREKDLFAKHSSGLYIHGYPDKVIKTASGLKVVDYKTGKRISHDPEDKPSMIQCTVYAYLTKNYLKKDVNSFEYRYLRLKRSVHSSDKGKTMKDHFDYLDEILNKLAESIKTGRFDKNRSLCKDCYWKDICARRDEK